MGFGFAHMITERSHEPAIGMLSRVLTGVEGCSSTRSTRRSNKLVVLDVSVDLAKKASEEAGAEVMVVMRSPDWHSHMRSRTYRFQSVTQPV